jgi:TonB-dependent receptor
MNEKLKRFKSRMLFTFVGGMLVINPAYAQDTPEADEDAKELEEVVVTGIRNSLEDSMGIKREAVGIVDAISAEDIGKFPDTNLAESLQRITGISIERRDGEGAQVTARGFGAGFNMVTLNGRQIPGADAFGAPGQVPIGGVDSGTRAFNFAQLAAEAVSGIEVHKTGQATVPSGGIGATINILTDRPLDHEGLVTSIGGKAVYDESQPFDDTLTPELSGIFSYTNPDKTWGVGLSASFQRRSGGSIQATENAWNIQRWTGTDPALRADAQVVNAPAIGQLYGIPNDMRYAFAEFERERVNAQSVLQFAPNDALRFTLDYTYSTNEITEDRGEQTMWLQRANSFTHLEFDTSNEVATPIYLREIAGGGKDFGYEQQHNEQKYSLDSLGFNADWRVTDRFSLTFDAHNTRSRSRPNDPLTGGGATYFSFAGTATNCTTGTFCGGDWAQEMWFNSGLPIAARTFYPSTAAALANANGTVNPDFPGGQLGSQVMRIYAMTQETEVTQGRIDGAFDFDNGRFQFGVNTAKVTMNRENATENYAALGDWGVSNAGNEPGMVALLSPFSLISLFNDFNTSGAPNGAWRGNASELARWAAGEYDVGTRRSTQLAADNQIDEDTDAIYLQVDMNGSLGDMATYMRAGVRYEKTDLVSTSIVAIPNAIEWQANNDFRILRGTELEPFSERTSYSHLLPNFDFSIDFLDDLKGRASISQTIARAPYGNLFAGPNPNQPTGSILVNPSTRAAGDAQTPTLVPLESDNLDLALEWYFADASYVSVTYWNKRVDNFVGNTVVRENLYGLRDPTSGPDAQAALAFLLSDACRAQVTAAGNNIDSGCSSNDTALFTALAMLRNAGATGGLGAYDGSSAQVIAMETAYNLYGEADDPLYLFDVNRPINQNKAKLRGWEMGGQYFFGDSGFGVLANYTIVNGDIGFDNTILERDQFALLGLSDTANAMFMYEKYGWSARLAWNWRDEYLIATNQNGSNRNPYYVEEYEQWDLSVNYAINEQLSVGFEAINLTGEDIRWHGRSVNQIIRLLDQSPRYSLGLRFKF